MIDDWGISCDIALIWISLDFTDDQSTLIQVMAWCRQATSHYLSQCWPRSLSPDVVARLQWVKLDWAQRLLSNLILCSFLTGLSLYRFRDKPRLVAKHKCAKPTVSLLSTLMGMSRLPFNCKRELQLQVGISDDIFKKEATWIRIWFNVIYKCKACSYQQKSFDKKLIWNHIEKTMRYIDIKITITNNKWMI